MDDSVFQKAVYDKDSHPTPIPNDTVKMALLFRKIIVEKELRELYVRADPSNFSENDFIYKEKTDHESKYYCKHAGRCIDSGCSFSANDPSVFRRR